MTRAPSRGRGAAGRARRVVLRCKHNTAAKGQTGGDPQTLNFKPYQARGQKEEGGSDNPHSHRRTRSMRPLAAGFSRAPRAGAPRSGHRGSPFDSFARRATHACVP